MRDSAIGAALASRRRAAASGLLCRLAGMAEVENVISPADAGVVDLTRLLAVAGPVFCFCLS